MSDAEAKGPAADPSNEEPQQPLQVDELELINEPSPDEVPEEGGSGAEARAEATPLPGEASAETAGTGGSGDEVTAEAGGDRSVGDEAEDCAPRQPHIIAVAGARGGVGKTILVTNLALYLATIGRRVVLVDADAGGGNAHTCIGTRQAPPLSRFRRGQRQEGGAIPDEALASTPYQGLFLVNAGFDEPAGPGSRGDRMVKLLAKARELSADYVIVDMGVGMSREFIDAYLSADLPLFVLAPEPTAIECTYRFMRGAFARHVMTTTGLDDDEMGGLERKIKHLGGAPAPLDLALALEEELPQAAQAVRGAMQRFRPHIVINQTRLRADLQLGFSMQSAAHRRLGIRLDYLGHVDHDDTVWTCARNRKPVLLDVPGAKSSKKIEKLARRLLMIQAGKGDRMPLVSVPRDSHHDTLELDRGATDEEVRRAYKRCREVYAHDALCCYGLLEPSEIEQIRSKIDEAFDVLLDPARRRPYELSVFPEELPQLEIPIEDDMDEPGRPMPELNPDTQFTGVLLRQVREAKRVSLREISQRTKIGVPYLQAIESEDFSRLPAVVYVSGFVTELSRYLRLDHRQVSRTYIRRFKRHLDERERSLLRGA